MSSFMMAMVAALAGELLLVLLAVLLVAWFRNRAARRRDIKAMRVLVSRIKNARTERETEIGDFLGQRMGLSGEGLEQAKSAIQRAELVLLQRFASVYKDRDAGAAAQFDIDLAAALVPYFELTGGGEGALTEPVPADPSELAALRAENTRLSDELSVTMETMSRMLNEYSTMFAGGASGAAASIGALTGANEAADPVAETHQEGVSSDVDDDIEVDLEVTVDPGSAEVAEAEDDHAVEAEAPLPDEGAGVTLETRANDPEPDPEDDGDGTVGMMAEAQAEAETDLAEAELEADVDVVAEMDAGDASDVVVEAGEQTSDMAVSPDTDVEQDVSQNDIDALFAVNVHDDLVDETDLVAGDSTTQDQPALSPEPDILEDIPDLAASDDVISVNDLGEEQERGQTEDAMVVVQDSMDSDRDDPASQSDAAVDVFAADDDLNEQGAGQVVEAPAVEIETGDDLETVTDFFEEGDAELVAFEESDDSVVDPAISADELFDPVEPETVVRAEEAALNQLLDDVEASEARDADDLFDAADRPLRTQSGP